MARRILVLSLLAITCANLALAFEPSPLQDFCVADPSGPVRVNGFACMDPKLAQASHFSFSGLHVAGNTENPLGSRVTPVTVAQIPGLNTLGVSLARIDYAPWGVVPPHVHPRATEILTVIEGSLEVGFVTSNPENRLITKVLQKGDVFVFPIGLVHFQRNVGHGNAFSISALSSQNPGVITIANAVFGSNPAIAADILAKAFQTDGSGRVNGFACMDPKLAQANHFYKQIIYLPSINIVVAFEPSPLQDFCVADPSGSARVNGFACMDPKLAQANHFTFSGLHVAGNTSNPLGSRVTPVTVAQIPGLNTLGASLARIDYAPWGVIPPHVHPRATEILTVIEGSLDVGFVTSNPENRLITKVLKKGDVFVFPIGLAHFQRNVGHGNAFSISALSSQNPGVITIANAVFGSNPSIADDLLAKAFQLDKSVVGQLQTKS
ncbi:hypothetical protein WN944_011967 [Citrus x changshan-huyou]|uniref:Cupin type-1 domain-containing protein n=1 Tax=Citrus x changshan-huyou TaxID=2935761 RepID=A0AAP0N0X5_9ROSI